MSDEYRIKGREFTKGVMDAIFFPFIFMVAVSLIYGYFIQPVDDSDINRFERSGMRIYTDNKTGIEYLGTSRGGLIERKQPHD